MIQPRNQFETTPIAADHPVGAWHDSIITARTPAKLIISGEHAVIYGQPALALAINRYTTTSITWHDSGEFKFNFSALQYQYTHDLHTMRKLNKDLQQNYQAFLDGKRTINSVLTKPADLVQYAVTSFLAHLNLTLPTGIAVHVTSEVPVGCGMGSSAAAVISTLYALGNFLNVNWQTIDYVVFAKHIEDLQHGKSSGLDLQLVTQGGCLSFKNGRTQVRNVDLVALQLVNTGQPDSSTGECVAQVAKILQADSVLLNEFAVITRAVDQALAENNISAFLMAIRANHQLLCKIGVVPPVVQEFITAIEHSGGAAKVCGAGAVSGSKAGMVLVVGSNASQSIASKYGYQLESVEVDMNGTQII